MYWFRIFVGSNKGHRNHWNCGWKWQLFRRIDSHMKTSFLRQYFNAFDFIEGAFLFDAALMFMAYNSLLYENGVPGDVLEIGVHHGRSAVAVASLRGDGREFFAVDLFEDLQSQNISASGLGNKAAFLRNM